MRDDRLWRGSQKPPIRGKLRATASVSICGFMLNPYSCYAPLKSHDLRLEGSRSFLLVGQLPSPPLLHLIPLRPKALPIKLDGGGNLCTTSSGRNRGVGRACIDLVVVSRHDGLRWSSTHP
ncbi:hypothetical protein N7G274_001765 [Stereocaulon virgatum]|uniref:Uncharacterized protein n=1 Tax=Stereocaulon virgatum TaxID=373712 RepID=A0ABR4AKM3_9LECA